MHWSQTGRRELANEVVGQLSLLSKNVSHDHYRPANRFLRGSDQPSDTRKYRGDDRVQLGVQLLEDIAENSD
jgi:hypothetical protein